ncbi:hypothetical protein AAKU64_000224 [Undibacterium sp. GrIS 1.8]|uniref:hypothetical protein n=1 Tax=Undibacterium sp. GrIS 1.8 TaxID=3143934 RepID=UPI003394FA40
MTHQLFRRLLTITFALLVASPSLALADVTEKISFDAASNSDLKKIAILRITPSQRITVKNANMAIAVGQRIGGLLPALLEGGAEGAKNGSQQAQYLELMKAKGITFVPEMLAALEKELSQSGYETVYLDKQRPILMEDKKTLDFSKVQTDADAILFVNYGQVGYSSPLLKSSYAPWVVMAARLVDAHTYKTLYFQSFNVTQVADKNTSNNLVAILPEEKYLFGTFDDLIGKFDLSTEGIVNCETKIAAYLGNQLKRN